MECSRCGKRREYRRGQKTKKRMITLAGGAEVWLCNYCLRKYRDLVTLVRFR